MQPALGMHDVQQDFANGPLGRRQALVQTVIGTCVEQRSQLVKVLRERALDIYKIRDDVYLNLFPPHQRWLTVSVNGGGGTTH